MRSHGLGLLIEMMDFNSGDEEAVRAWIDEDHLKKRLSAPGICGAATYEAITGTPRYLNLYEADNVQYFYGEEFQEVLASHSERDGEMKNSIVKEVRLVCSQIYPGLPPSSPACPTVDVAGLAPVIQLGRIFVPPEKIGDFNGWYAQDRAPRTERIPGVRRIRRYAPIEGDPVMVVLYELDDETPFDSPEWKEMAATSWTSRVRGYYRQADGSPGKYRRRGYAY